MKLSKIIIGMLTISLFLQNNSIIAEETIDCENEDFKNETPSYALTEEEKVQRLDTELIYALNKFDECIENKNKSLATSSNNASSSASRSSFGENSTASIQEKENSSKPQNTQTLESNNAPLQSGQNQPSIDGDGSISEGDIESNYDDDDIVARQLREAAMAEEDEAIRELLWERYRDYKGIKIDSKLFTNEVLKAVVAQFDAGDKIKGKGPMYM